jgi:hypothetical protein
LFEDGVQTPALLAHVVPVEDAVLTAAGGRLRRRPAAPPGAVGAGGRSGGDHAGRADELNFALVATKRSVS